MIRNLPVLIIFARLAAHAATITASTAQPSYDIGNFVPVQVSIENVADLYAFQFDLSFDPRVISAQSIAEGGYFLANGISFSPGAIDNTAGTISFIADSLSGPVPGFTGDTLLATATFTAIAPGSTTISPVNVVLLDSGLSEITANTSAVSISISDVPTSPEPRSPGLLFAGGIWASLIAFRRQVIRK